MMENDVFEDINEAEEKKTCTRGMGCRRFKQTYYEKTFTNISASASPASHTEAAVGLRFEMVLLNYFAGSRKKKPAPEGMGCRRFKQTYYEKTSCKLSLFQVNRSL